MALLPIACTSHISQQSAALPQAGAAGGCKGDNSLAGEIIVLHKIVDRPGGDAPPDWIADVNRVVFGPVVNGALYQLNIPQALVIMLKIYPAAVCCPV